MCAGWDAARGHLFSWFLGRLAGGGMLRIFPRPHPWDVGQPFPAKDWPSGGAGLEDCALRRRAAYEGPE